MALIDDLRTELVGINEATTEIAEDIDALLARIEQNENVITEEDLENVRAIAARLRETAAKYPSSEA